MPSASPAVTTTYSVSMVECAELAARGGSVPTPPDAHADVKRANTSRPIGSTGPHPNTRLMPDPFRALARRFDFPRPGESCSGRAAPWKPRRNPAAGEAVAYLRTAIDTCERNVEKRS